MEPPVIAAIVTSSVVLAGSIANILVTKSQGRKTRAAAGVADDLSTQLAAYDAFVEAMVEWINNPDYVEEGVNPARLEAPLLKFQAKCSPALGEVAKKCVDTAVNAVVTAVNISGGTSSERHRGWAVRQGHNDVDPVLVELKNAFNAHLAGLRNQRL